MNAGWTEIKATQHLCGSTKCRLEAATVLTLVVWFDRAEHTRRQDSGSFFRLASRGLEHQGRAEHWCCAMGQTSTESKRRENNSSFGRDNEIDRYGRSDRFASDDCTGAES